MSAVSDFLQRLGRIEVLRDDRGVPYDSTELSCTWLPHLWDDDAEPADKRHAQYLCLHECPALAACQARRNQIKTAAEGVWGGTIIRRRREPDQTDPVVREWADTFGVELPPPPRKNKKGRHDAVL